MSASAPWHQYCRVSYERPHLRSVPHNWGSGVAQLVSAWSLVIMPQENVTLQIQITDKKSTKLWSQEPFNHIPNRRWGSLVVHSHPDSADSTSRRCVCSSYTASVHSPGSSRCRSHTKGTAWWPCQSRCRSGPCGGGGWGQRAVKYASTMQ